MKPINIYINFILKKKVEVWKKIQEITKQIKDINRIDKTNEKNNAN